MLISNKIVNDEKIYIKDKLLISDRFHCHFSLTNTNYSFEDVHNMDKKEAKVKHLIEWIEGVNKSHDNGDKRKFITNQTKMAVDKILRKLKDWDQEGEISIM
jgi:hypothetical protein